MIDPPNQSEPTIQSGAHPARIALAHDWLVARRGGELVLDAIINALQSNQHTISALYSMFDSGAPITSAIDHLSKTISPLNRYPASLRRWLLFKYPGAIAHLSEQLLADHQSNPIELLISTHSSAIKAIAPPSPSIPHICYCHTPARYLWSQADAYRSPGFKGRLRTAGLNLFTPSLRKWDKATAASVSLFIANSSHTQSQINEHYNRDAIVIHPPVRTDFFTLPAKDSPRNDNLLLVSALEPYKRVDLAIDASAIAKRPLTIIGSGSHESALRKHAERSNAQVKFLGQISDESLRTQYQTAHAFLFPQIEDFGITAVESQSCGCPIVARRAGGALDTVIENQTGSYFDEVSPKAIARAIESIPTDQSTPENCRTNALRFSESVFAIKFNQVVAQALNKPFINGTIPINDALQDPSSARS